MLFRRRGLRVSEEMIHDIISTGDGVKEIHSVLGSVLHCTCTIYHRCMQPCIVCMQAEDTTSSVLY